MEWVRDHPLIVGGAAVAAYFVLVAVFDALIGFLLVVGIAVVSALLDSSADP